jgi:hypothetical protein
MVDHVGGESTGERRQGQVGPAGAITSSVVAACAVLRQHWLAHLPPHPVPRPHRRCLARPKAGQRSCFIPKR